MRYITHKYSDQYGQVDISVSDFISQGKVAINDYICNQFSLLLLFHAKFCNFLCQQGKFLNLNHHRPAVRIKNNRLTFQYFPGPLLKFQYIQWLEF